ncbi:MAG: SUMF1/EgtB/PvdO family nonheme iron enzyme, partial [Chloroflexi bacterium]|nr:SUMF1/EgtB/PvdO family nonheme iron enzyme [Chloroflexota bacterium]
MPDPLLNTSLGPYRIIAELGRGGMAVVYKGIQPALSREVAIKVLPPYFAHDPNFVERFKREAQNAARLKHPNIVVIHDVGEAQGYHFIVMEMLEGATLQQIIQRAGVLSLERAAKILEQIASALDYAHARGFIHRDIKPSNIIVGENDFATLTDFGIAKAIEGSSFTSTGAAIGTPAYMSPEQALGDKNIDSRTDIYSLGVVAYEMVSGRVPFTGETTPAILHKVIYETPPRLRSINPRVSERVEQTISKAMAKQPAQRFARAAELASALTVRSEVKTPLPEDVTRYVPPRVTKPAQPIVVPPPPPMPVQSRTPKPVTPIVPPRASKQTSSRFPFLLAGVGGCAVFLALAVFAIGFLSGVNKSAEMVSIPEGEFLMGSGLNDTQGASDEKPQHLVYLDAFMMDKFEVTNALYKKCVDARSCARPSESKSYTRSSYYGNPSFDNYPVIYVSWNDADTYCKWLGKRLPTEAEWEKAARGTDGRIYPWGNSFEKNRLNSIESGRDDTTEVGIFPTGASPYGAQDMAGNVWEWVADWYDNKYYFINPPTRN